MSLGDCKMALIESYESGDEYPYSDSECAWYYAIPVDPKLRLDGDYYDADIEASYQ